MLWLSNVRRDISYGVKELSKFVHAPTEEDQQRATNLLKYLNGTKDLVLHLCPNKDDFFDIVTYTDSDLGGCETSRKSTSGGTLSISGSIFHSWAKKKETIAMSSGEAEFIALCTAAKETAYVLHVLSEMGIKCRHVPKIYVDSTVALAMVSAKTVGRVKHIDRALFWIKEMVKLGKITLEKVHGSVNLADLFTKWVDKSTLEKLRPAVMGNVPPPPNPPGGKRPTGEEINSLFITFLENSVHVLD